MLYEVITVRLGGEGQLGEVVQGPKIVRVETHLLETLAVERHVARHAADGGLQALELHPFQGGAVHAFVFWIVITSYSIHYTKLYDG